VARVAWLLGIASIGRAAAGRPEFGGGAWGELIDRVIVGNRIRARDQRVVRRRQTPRQPGRRDPVSEGPASGAAIENRA